MNVALWQPSPAPRDVAANVERACAVIGAGTGPSSSGVAPMTLPDTGTCSSA